MLPFSGVKCYHWLLIIAKNHILKFQFCFLSDTLSFLALFWKKNFLRENQPKYIQTASWALTWSRVKKRTSGQFLTGKLNSPLLISHNLWMLQAAILRRQPMRSTFFQVARGRFEMSSSSNNLLSAVFTSLEGKSAKFNTLSWFLISSSIHTI